MKNSFVSLLVVFCLAAHGIHSQPLSARAVLTENSGAREKLAAFEGDEKIRDRIKRIENGLLSPAIIKGARPERLKLNERMRHYNAPGVSVAVINDGKIEWARGYGLKEAGKIEPVTADTLFQVGSISKPVTAFAALALVEQGKLSLDEDINRKLVSWKIPENEFTKREKVTLRRLLSHSAGLPPFFSHSAGNSGEQPPTITQVLKGEQPAKNPPAQVEFEPGSKFQYSNIGYAIVQLLMTDVTGKSFPALMKELVFDPLGMINSTFEQPPAQPFSARAASGHNSTDGKPLPHNWQASPFMAAGGLWTTAGDLARFVIGIQEASAGKSNKVLSAFTAQLMLSRQNTNWSLGFEINGEGANTRFLHNGSSPGFTADLIAYKARGQGAVVLVNEDFYNGFQLTTEIKYGIAREYGWTDFAPVEKTVARLDPRLFNKYTGRYEIDRGFPVTIVSKNNRLYLIWANGGKYELYPESETKFFIIRDGIPIFTFHKDRNTEITSVTRDWYREKITGSRLPLPAPSRQGNTTFRLKGYKDALIVSVAGSFNNWNSLQTLCAPERDEWVCRLNLAPGKYPYKFVVDNKWILDPQNPNTENDGAGNNNSVVSVEEK